MIKIVAGTTPTIIYRFRVVDPADLVYALLTIEYCGRIVLQKTLEDADVGEKSLSWRLSQEETLSLPDIDSKRKAHMMVNWLSDEQIRGASKRVEICKAPNDVKRVIP